jgi:hypothetical protein
MKMHQVPDENLANSCGILREADANFWQRIRNLQKWANLSVYTTSVLIVVCLLCIQNGIERLIGDCRPHRHAGQSPSQVC